MGSGPTPVSCERTGRVSVGSEIDLRYRDVIIARWEAFTGLKAVKADDLSLDLAVYRARAVAQ